jgi:hypothetical protein
MLLLRISTAGARQEGIMENWLKAHGAFLAGERKLSEYFNDIK